MEDSYLMALPVDKTSMVTISSILSRSNWAAFSNTLPLSLGDASAQTPDSKALCADSMASFISSASPSVWMRTMSTRRWWRHYTTKLCEASRLSLTRTIKQEKLANIEHLVIKKLSNPRLSQSRSHRLGSRCRTISSRWTPPPFHRSKDHTTPLAS